MREFASAIFSAILRRRPTSLMSSTELFGCSPVVGATLRAAREERFEVLDG